MTGRCGTRVFGLLLLCVSVAASAGCAASRPATDPGSTHSPLVRASDGFYDPSEKPVALPAVAASFGQEPKPTTGVGARPASVKAIVVSRGQGEPVPVTRTPGVRYVETRWSDGQILHDSWSQRIAVERPPGPGPAVVVYRYLQMVPVGSRVEVVVPDGTGDALVFVIDIQQASLAVPGG